MNPRAGLERGRRGHAVVLGASMAGLLTARVLSETFDTVTVVERDDLSTPGDRRGVPQGRHVHALLARGKQNVEALFPGITAELLADGAVDCRSLTEMRMTISGHTLHRSDGGYSLLQASRPFLEWRVRQRVRALANVRILDRTNARALTTDSANRRVTGVDVEDDSGRRDLSADLVVSCLGRHGPITDWLAELGYDRPAEEGLRIDMMYASRYLRLPGGSVGDKEIVIAGRDPARGLALFAIEDGLHILTLIGYGGDHPPTDSDGFWRFAASVAPPDVRRALVDAEPLGEISTYRYLANQRRRYERLRRFPDGLLVLGDAVCSFSPAFGQGMTVSSLQALALRAVLAAGDHELASRFFRAAAGVVDDAWTITRLFDLAMPHVDAQGEPRLRAIGSLTQVAVALGARDATLGQQISRIAGLLDGPATVLSPRVLAGAARAAVALGADRVRSIRSTGASPSQPSAFDPLPTGPAPGFHLLPVATVHLDTPDSTLIEFAVPDSLADRYSYLAGQHVVIRGLHRGRPVRRSYSLCDTPGHGRLRIAVKHQDGGAFSAFARDQLTAGTLLHVSEPTGTFTATPCSDRADHYAAVAAGSGITPIVSIIATVLTDEPASTVTLHYGSRDQGSTMLADPLTALSARFPDRLRIVHHLSRQHPPTGTGNVAYRHGRLAAADLDAVDADHWFVCGPAELTRSIVTALSARGIDAERVHLELFATAAPEPTVAQPDTPPCEVTLTGYGDDLVFTMPQGRPILGEAVRHRDDLPYSCLGGSCGTCLASVRSGRVVMDPDPLLAIGAADLAAGKVLACRAYADDDAVTLRFGD
ncbi:FAD-dependent monooxygenase [Nocardia sp. NPDC058379]|uniref:FAD-dependent monooxygenase n=1 Tax=unclassified Nocardia TaxID=2637762 RepID=UPI0036612456